MNPLRSKIIELFENTIISQQPRLKPVKLSDEQFVKIMEMAPGEINILLARAASIAKNETEKTKKQYTMDILEVLERSNIARYFESISLLKEYHLFRGFPVRKGDPHEKMPSQGSNIQLKEEDFYQIWTTDAAAGREIALKYDPTLGEPIGGLLVDTHVSPNVLYHDINAIIRTCKDKLQVIRQYNLNAPQGKAISKKNVDFLATEYGSYSGIYEVLTDSSIVHVTVTDKWVWKHENGKNVPKWTVGMAKEETPKEEMLEGNQ